MLLNQFDSRFPNEDSCIAYFQSLRETNLPVCSDCGCVNYSWLPKKQAFEYDLFDRLVKISATYISDIKWRDYSGENDNEIDV